MSSNRSTVASKPMSTLYVARARRQGGNIIVPLLIVAILVVLFLLWQGGHLGGSATSSVTSQQAAPASVESTANAGPGTPSEPEPPPPPLTGKSPNEIDALVTELLEAHPQDLSACGAEPDPKAALDCAAKEQNRVLAALFEDYNARVASNELTASERGGVVMQRVVLKLQQVLEPYIKAADEA